MGTGLHWLAWVKEKFNRLGMLLWTRGAGLSLTGRHGSGDPERSALLPRHCYPLFCVTVVFFLPLSAVEIHRAASSGDKSPVKLSVNSVTSVSFTSQGSLQHWKDVLLRKAGRVAAPNKLDCVLPVRIVFSAGQVFSGVKMGSICCNTHRQTDTHGHKIANMTGDESGWQVYALYHVFYSEPFLMCGTSHS